MKKRKTALLAFSLLTLSAFGVSSLSSCGSTNASESEIKVIVTGPSTGTNGNVGDTVQLNAQVIGDESNSVTWESSDISIATVDENGLVTLLRSGSAQITATSTLDTSKKSSPVHITVYESGEKRLEIASLPTKTNYKLNEKVSYDGLSIMAYSYFDGVKAEYTAEDIPLSEVSISVAEGSELTEKGTKIVTVTKSGYISASFTLTVGETITTSKLYISSLPNTVTYTLTSSKGSDDKTATFSTRGLKVQQLTYVDGVLDSTRTLSSTEYTLSLLDGSTLTKEGNYTIDVTSKTANVEGTSFNIIVYTEDTSVYDIIKTLQTTKNYTAEVFNNVGTTTDVTGFHYLRKYTEKYYDETEFQNINSGTEIIFSEEIQKSHVGYTTYDTGTETGIMEYGYDWMGSVTPSRVISTGYDSWWDKANSLARLFTLFDLNNVPTATLNGSFLTTVVEQVDGDDDMGTKTIAKYPLIGNFLDYCGWSSSLITIMNRFTISFNDDGNLTMKADFGSYGYTELVISDIGTTVVDDVEAFIENGGTATKPEAITSPAVKTIKSAFSASNYTRYGYGDNGTDKTDPYGYYNEDYIYSVKDGYGFGKVGENKVQRFTGTNNVFKAVGEPIELSSNQTFEEYANAQFASSNYFKGYVASAMTTTFGKDENDNGLLYTFGVYSGLSSDTMVTYQSFDDQALQDLVNYIGGGEITDYRFWFMVTYSQYKDETSYEDLKNISSIEIWDINAVSLSGYVMAFADFGTTSVDWIESGLASVNASLSALESVVK